MQELTSPFCSGDDEVKICLGFRSILSVHLLDQLVFMIY